MTLEDIKDYFTSSYRFGKMMNMAPTNFCSWKNKGYVPMRAQIKIERFTNGELKANYKDAQPYD